MNQSMQPNDWDYPAHVGFGGAGIERLARRAAVLVWVIAGLELLLGGCCAFSFGALAAIPTEQILKEAQGQMTIDQLNKFKELAPAFAIGAVILAVVPATAYLVLGFFVRRANKVGLWIAAVLTLGQSLIMGLIVLLALAVALMQGNLLGLTIVVVLYGTPLGLLGYTTWLLGRCVLTKTQNLDEQMDNWD